MKRTTLTIVGLVLGVLGAVWVLQGLNVLPGSVMTGQLFWAGAGAVLLVIAAILLYLAYGRRTRAL